jgi:hypothetical protein
MSRSIRRSCVLVGLLVVAIIPLGASVAGAQQLSPITVNVRKVVSGTATAGSSVTLSCLTESITFNFDATGAPTTADAGGANVAIVDGAWQLTGSADSSELPCTLNETATGGAASTSWSCDYTNAPTEAAPSAEQVVELGCAAASGANAGPVGLTLGSFLDVSSQTADVTFTNTYTAAPPLQPIQPAPSVVVQPTFTG